MGWGEENVPAGSAATVVAGDDHGLVSFRLADEVKGGGFRTSPLKSGPILPTALHASWRRSPRPPAMSRGFTSVTRHGNRHCSGKSHVRPTPTRSGTPSLPAPPAKLSDAMFQSRPGSPAPYAPARHQVRGRARHKLRLFFSSLPKM